MEDKKISRLGGSKVSQIANIFQQGMAPNKDNSTSEYIGPVRTKPAKADDSPTFEKEVESKDKDSPAQVTVMRTESHLARFNNARALFEQLGQEGKPIKPTERFIPITNAKSASNIPDIRAKAPSGGCYGDATATTEHRTRTISGHSDSTEQHRSRTSSGHSETSTSSSPERYKCAAIKSQVHNNSVPVLNNNCANNSSNSHSNGVNGVSVINENDDLGGVVPCAREKTTTTNTNGNANEILRDSCENRTSLIKPAITAKKPEKPEKPERKFNSRELIEKQRNWTSHFSKARSTRYNSDPNKSEVRLGLSNGSKDKTEDNRNDVQQSGQPATRSASFSARIRSPPTSPPPPPIRTEASKRPNVVRRDRPASVIPTTTTSTTTPQSPTKGTSVILKII